MNLHPSTQQVTERLQLALTNGHFQSELQPVGQKLLAHLRKPTQISVMGFNGVGKSSLIKMILGTEDILLPQSVAISELVFGSSPRVTFEGPRNGVSHHANNLETHDIPEGTLRVVQELPLDQLKGKSLVEFNLPARTDHQKIILDWAIETTDILIWCTQNFDAREAALWEAIPDRLKDHSLLALTKADRMQMQGALKVQSARFEQELAEEFLGMFPVATKQAISARDGEVVTQTELWANSGGQALMDGLKRQINSGKMADIDQADMLLARAKRAQGATKVTNGTAPCSANRPTVPSHADTDKISKDEMLKNALSNLDDCAQTMGDTSGQDALSGKDVLAQALQAIQTLNSILSQTEDPAVAYLKNDASECEQLVLLLQLENTDAAANDALTALLQLKKELAQEAYA